MGQIVSFSGGKDSTAMLLMMLERGEPIDEVVFFDSGWEFDEMYEHVAMVECATGIQITRVRPEKSFDHLMFEHVLKRGKRAGQRGYGWPRPNARWCTTYKNRAISKALAGLGGVTQCVGIAADEATRVRDKRYPLVEWGVTEDMALSYCVDRGFDWGGYTSTSIESLAGAVHSSRSTSSGASVGTTSTCG